MLFVGMMAVGLAAAFFVSQGDYPIAMVGNSFVSAKAYATEYQAATLYYQNVLKTYGTMATDTPAITPPDLEAGAMDALVEDTLIKDEAVREVGAGDLASLVQDKLSKYSGNSDLANAGATLYGLDKQTFWDDILVPEATKEVLTDRLVSQGKNIDDWVSTARKSARVIIFSPQLTWDGTQVNAK